MKQLIVSNRDASSLAKAMEFLDVSDPEQHECYDTIRKILNEFDKRKPMRLPKRGGQCPEKGK